MLQSSPAVRPRRSLLFVPALRPDRYLKALDSGADIVVLTANSWDAYFLSLEVARQAGRVSILGFPGRGQPPPAWNPLDPKWLYAKQLTLLGSGRAPALECKPEELRFNVRRNLEYILDLMAARALCLKPVISHTLPWRRMREAYELARQHFPDGNPLGRRLRINVDHANGRDDVEWTVVGVVASTRSTLDGPMRQTIYLPRVQRPGNNLVFFVRTAADPETVAGSVAATVSALEPEAAVEMRTLEDVVGATIARPRAISVLLGFFALVALRSARATLTLSLKNGASGSF